MSTEIFLGLSEVCRFDQELPGLGGKTSDALLSTVAHMGMEGAVSGGLQEIVDIASWKGDPQEVIDEQHSKGLYLFGANLGTPDYHRVMHAPYDVVVFAHAEDKVDFDDTFSLVHMAVWTRAGLSRDPQVTQQRVIDLSLTDPYLTSNKRNFRGIPIAGHALIAPFRLGDFEPFIYGHKKLTDALGGIAIPSGLRSIFMNEMNEYYRGPLQRLVQYNASRIC